MPELNHEFFAERARLARELADKATEPGIREIHERMAKDYTTLVELKRPVGLPVAG